MVNETLAERAPVLESDSVLINSALGAVSLLISSCLVLAITVISRTRKLPYSTKLLSVTLLGQTCAVLTVTTARRFLSSPVVNVQLSALAQCFRLLTCGTLIVMSLERYLCICRPFVYARHVTYTRVKVMVSLVSAGVALMQYGTRFGYYFLLFDSHELLTVPWGCKQPVAVINVLLYLSASLTGGLCNLKIHALLKRYAPKSLDKVSVFRRLKDHKSTIMFLLSYPVFIARMVLNALLIYLVEFSGCDVWVSRICMDIQWFVYSILFMLIHVVWFKECRLELYKMLSVCSKRYGVRAERMRIEVFDIVVNGQKSTSNSPITA